ncbi:alpha/beta fold hydrolase [Bdellovibrio sp. GT3]|uniref:alpha/beta fold hydrolase n=1 Tax=Bdellovibrio sp. GT3 TaxID=3136282 RepID=UPI0030F05B83
MSKVSVTDKVVSISEGSLFVRQWVPPTVLTKDPLILLHDSLGSVEQWRSFPEQLAERLSCPVIAYDRMGFGKSTARSALPSQRFIEEEATVYFPQLRKELGFNRFALFGHSVGGGMALEIAAHYPEFCTAIVSESAQAFVEDRTIDGITKAKVAFQNEEQLNKLRKWHGDKAEWVLHAWTDVWLSKDFENWQLKPALSNVTSPTLVIHGERDEFGSVAFPNLIANNVRGPVKEWVLPGVGHVPHRENPELILNLVSEFFADYLQTAR